MRDALSQRGVESAGGALVYSGDTAPCAGLTSLAEGCDVLLCEAEGAQAPTEGDQVHHTPEDAGETAAAARAGRLIITHIGRFLTPQQAVARASAHCDGPTDYAVPGAAFEIGEFAGTLGRRVRGVQDNAGRGSVTTAESCRHAAASPESPI